MLKEMQLGGNERYKLRQLQGRPRITEYLLLLIGILKVIIVISYSCVFNSVINNNNSSNNGGSDEPSYASKSGGRKRN